MSSSNRVTTSAHCFWEEGASSRAFANNMITVLPGYTKSPDGSTYKSATCSVTGQRKNVRWANGAFSRADQYRNDLYQLRLSCDNDPGSVPSAGPPLSFGVQPILGVNVATAGYPGLNVIEPGGVPFDPLPPGWVEGRQYKSTGRTMGYSNGLNGGFLTHRADTGGGQSGSPIYQNDFLYPSSNGKVIGVHGSGPDFTDHNEGPGLFAFQRNWINSPW